MKKLLKQFILTSVFLNILLAKPSSCENKNSSENDNSSNVAAKNGNSTDASAYAKVDSILIAIGTAIDNQIKNQTGNQTITGIKNSTSHITRPDTPQTSKSTIEHAKYNTNSSSDVVNNDSGSSARNNINNTKGTGNSSSSEARNFFNLDNKFNNSTNNITDYKQNDLNDIVEKTKKISQSNRNISVDPTMSKIIGKNNNTVSNTNNNKSSNIQDSTKNFTLFKNLSNDTKYNADNSTVAHNNRSYNASNKSNLNKSNSYNTNNTKTTKNNNKSNMQDIDKTSITSSTKLNSSSNTKNLVKNKKDSWNIKRDHLPQRDKKRPREEDGKKYKHTYKGVIIAQIPTGLVLDGSQELIRLENYYGRLSQRWFISPTGYWLGLEKYYIINAKTRNYLSAVLSNEALRIAAIERAKENLGYQEWVFNEDGTISNVATNLDITTDNLKKRNNIFLQPKNKNRNKLFQLAFDY